MAQTERNAKLKAYNLELLAKLNAPRPTSAPGQVGRAVPAGLPPQGAASQAGSIAGGAHRDATSLPPAAPSALFPGGPGSPPKKLKTHLDNASKSAVVRAVSNLVPQVLELVARNTPVPVHAKESLASNPSLRASTPSQANTADSSKVRSALSIGSDRGSAPTHPKPGALAPKSTFTGAAPMHATRPAPPAAMRPAHGVSAFAPRAAAKVGPSSGHSFRHASGALPFAKASLVPLKTTLVAESAPPASCTAASISVLETTSAASAAPGTAASDSVDCLMSEAPCTERGDPPVQQVVEPTSAAGSAPSAIGAASRHSFDTPMHEPPRTELVDPPVVDLSADGAQCARPKLHTLGEEIGALNLNTGPDSRPSSPSGLKVTVWTTFLLLVSLVSETIPGTIVKRYYLHANFPKLTNPHWMVTNDRGQYTFKSKGTASDCWKWRLPDWGFRAKAEDCEQDRKEFEENLQEQFRLFVKNRAQPVRSLRRGLFARP